MTDSPSRTVSLVVGGTSGIGAQTARLLVDRGHCVVAVGSRSDTDVASLAPDIGFDAYVQADMENAASPERVIDLVESRYGRLDHLVYSAGATLKIPHADLEAVTDEVWMRILGVNVMAPWRLVRAATPLLRRSGDATATFVGALCGVDVGGSSIPYAVSKAALHHMVKLLGAVLGPEIRINAVAPGLIETAWTEGEAWEGLFGLVRDKAPLRRPGTPNDVATLIVGLIDSRYVTGQTVVIDGGLSLTL